MRPRSENKGERLRPGRMYNVQHAAMTEALVRRGHTRQHSLECVREGGVNSNSEAEEKDQFRFFPRHTNAVFLQKEIGP